MVKKESPDDDSSSKLKKLYKLIVPGIITLLFAILVVGPKLWPIIQPKKPSFILKDVTLYAFNLTTVPSLLSSVIHITIYSRNPNSKAGIYYDKLDAFATYHNQQITYYISIPPTYQGHKNVNVWSPFILGNNIPIAPYDGVALIQDQADGLVRLAVKRYGQLRFKVGAFTSKHRLHVDCQAVIPFSSRTTGIVVSDAIKYQLSETCSVSL